ncbi:MAG: glycosyltransferase family 4 protein [Lachnospiraceae bacterium]|jgi:glycosyltransferase involved in cell wall biosynthesis
MKKIRIAADARNLGSRPSGVGMYFYDFLKILGKDERFEFILLTDVQTSEYMKQCRGAGMEVRAYGTAVNVSSAVFRYFRWIKKELETVRPDLFWEVNSLIPVRLGGNFRTMITIHDMFPLEYPQYVGRVYSLYFRLALRRTLKDTDMILYNSEQTRKSTLNFFPQAAEKKSADSYIIAHPLRIRRDLTDQNYFLYVGNMELRKGVDILLKAYEKYRSGGGKRPLVLAGKIQEEPIGGLIRQMQEKVPGITYKNYVPHEEKHALYAACSCFVFPSRAEGFGMPVIEVMKFYKPVIVSDLPIYNEIEGPGVLRTSPWSGTDEERISALASSLAAFDADPDKSVDRAKYDEVIGRYSPERLGRIVSDFIVENV